MDNIFVRKKGERIIVATAVCEVKMFEIEVLCDKSFGTLTKLNRFYLRAPLNG